MELKRMAVEDLFPEAKRVEILPEIGSLLWIITMLVWWLWLMAVL